MTGPCLMAGSLVAVLSLFLLQLTTTRADNHCSVTNIDLGSNVTDGTTPLIGDSQVYSLTCTATVTCNMTSNITMDGITLNIANGLGNVVVNSSNMVTDFMNDVFNVTLPVGSPVQLSDAGLYTCTVSINEMLSDMSDTFLFNVTIQTPSVTDVSNDLVRIDDQSTLTCTVTISNDNPLLFNASVTWSPSNGVSEGPVVRSSSSDNTFMANYVVNNVGIDDAQDYTCSATISSNSNNDNILSSYPRNGTGTIYATDISLSTNSTIVLDVSPYNVFSTMCNVTYYPDGAPIMMVLFDISSNGTGDSALPINSSMNMISSPIIDDGTVIVNTAGVFRYTCRANVTIDGLTLTSIDSNSIDVTIRGPADPVLPIVLNPIPMNESAIIRWSIPRISYTPENYTVSYGFTCNDTITSITDNETTRNVDNLQFLTDTDEEYSVTIENLIRGKTYCYRINSTNTVGSTGTDLNMFTTQEAAPSKPNNVQIISVTSVSFILTWDEPSSPNGLILFYNYTCANLNFTDSDKTGDVDGDTLQAFVSDLLPFSTYECFVNASTAAGVGNSSDIVTVTTDEDVPSGPPTNFNVTSSNTSPNQLVLVWNLPDPEFRNGIITEYSYRCFNDSFSTDVESTASTTATVTGLDVFTTYTCEVKAATSVGISNTAATNESRTGEAAPNEVTNLVFRPTNETSFDLDWTQPDTLRGILSHYNIYVFNYSNNELVTLIKSTSPKATVTSNDFRNGVPYYVNVSAVTGGGEGPTVSILNFTQQGTPAQVENVAVDRINNTAIRVSWKALTIVQAQGFFEYEVVVSPVTESTRKRRNVDTNTCLFNSGTNTYTCRVDSATTSRIIGNLDPAAMYQVTVTAVNDLNEGDMSEVIAIPTFPPSVTSTPTTTPTPTADSTDKPSNATGIIVGVVCGCLVLILVIIVAVLAILIVRKKMDTTKDPEVHQNMAILDNISKRDQDEDGNELKLLSVKQNPEFNERMQAVAVPDFADHVHHLHMNRDLGFEEEYESLKSIPIGSFTVAKMQANIPKNRFDNVYSYDDSRVILPIPEGGNSDYINASFIDGYNRPKAYIAAQGPLVNTVTDFWHMIWEFQLPTIVMLTELVERGIEKCTCYYPRSTNETLDVGRGLQVTCTEQQQYVEYKFKKFLLVNTNKDGGRLDVVHYHFLAWPDHGVPADKTVMMAFARRVRQTHPPEGPPLIVHCSAGVGRTGTFIVLDTMMQRLEKSEGSLNIYELVADMRSKRTLMVQTMAQYIYTHDALSEYIICGDTSITTKGLRDKMNELSKVSGGESGYKKQLDLLNQISRAPSEGHCSESLSKQNVVKNRYSQEVASLPYNETRVRLRTTSGVGDYINASIVDGYKHRGAFLATQAPLESTTDDLWRMVWEQWSASIVMLCSLDEEESLHCYWPQTVDEKQVHGVIEVKLVSEKEEKDFIVRKFELSQESNYINLATGNADKLLVTQFQYTQWPVEGKPSKCDSLLKLLDQLLKTQKLSGNKAITVMCNNGIDRTGAFICLYSQLERVKVEGIADMFQFVKASRFNRPGLVQSLDNYIFCHELIVEFLNSFDQYENFK